MTDQSKKDVSRRSPLPASTNEPKDKELGLVVLLSRLAGASKIVKRSAAAALNLGLMLLQIKEKAGHGEFLPVVQHIGLGRSFAERLMKCALRLTRFEKVISASQSQSHLFELIALSDDELCQLDLGETVRGVNLETLGSMTVKQLRQTIKAGDTPKTEKTKVIAAKAEQTSVPAMPPSAAPILGDKPVAGDGFELSPETYPAVYTLLPGEFNSRPISIIRHEGRSWLMAEDVVAALGDLPEGSPYPCIEHLVDFLFRVDSWSANRTCVRLASSTLVIRILDQEAVRYLCELADTNVAHQLAAWFGKAGAATEPAAVVPIISAKPRMTLKEVLEGIGDTNLEIDQTFLMVEAQIKAINVIVQEWKTGKDAYHIDPLVDIAERLIAPWHDLVDRQDGLITEVSHRLEWSPDDATVLPEYVWLDLVTALSSEHSAGKANDHFSEVARIVGIMAKYGNSPEVVAAVRLVEDYVQRQGAYLFDSATPGVVGYAREKGKQSPLPTKARETVLAH